MTVTVRHATETDRALIWSMLLDMSKEMAPYSVSLRRVDERIDQVLRRGVALIAENDGQAIGTIGLLGQAGSWFTDDRVVSDTWIYVRPDRRSIKAWGMLVLKAMEYARDNNLPLVLCLYTMKDTERKARLFERAADRIMRAWRFVNVGGEYRIKMGEKVSHGRML